MGNVGEYRFHIKYLKIILSLLLVLLVAGCSQDKWEGFVYPDRGNLTKHIYVGEFQSLEACRDIAIAKLEQLGALTRGDYECGKNCRVKSGFTVRICEETLR